MNIFGALSLASAVSLASLVAEAPERPAQTAADALLEQRLSLEQTREGYTGAGWDRLIQDGAEAQFFMIGEQHATADIALFAVEVYKALAQRGYTHAAYEIGSYSTDFVEQLIRSGNGKLANYIRQPGHTLTLPFLSFQEEVDLIEEIVRASPDREDTLWGLDQEFVGSGPIVVELLRQWAQTDAEMTAVDAFATQLTSNPMLIGVAPWSELEPLEKAFRSNAPASEFIQALRLSNEIYRPFTGRGGTRYEANLLRENYMKANFAAHFAEAERRNGRPPKVFMKFGGYHAQRGFTGTNVPGFGNFLYEWGLPRGFTYLNVMVECIGGETLDARTNETAPCRRYFSEDSVLGSLPKTEKFTLIDLRPLRSKLQLLTDLDIETRQLILAFDYYLAIKDVQAATPVSTTP